MNFQHRKRHRLDRVVQRDAVLRQAGRVQQRAIGRAGEVRSILPPARNRAESVPLGLRRLGSRTIDLAESRVLLSGLPVKLTPKEFQLLDVFVRI